MSHVAAVLPLYLFPMPTRRATSADAPAIQALIDLYVPSGTLLPRSVTFIAEHADDFVVAVRDGEVMGCVHLDDYSPSLAEIRSLAVHPSAHGLGLGVELVDAGEALARKRHYRTIFAVSNNESFFLGCGFTPRFIPELDRERSEVSRYKGVYAKELAEGAGAA